MIFAKKKKSWCGAMTPWLERRMSVPLLDRNHLVPQYIGPLPLLEHNTLLDEFKDEFIGVYHDGTTYMGEAFCIIFRCVKASAGASL